MLTDFQAIQTIEAPKAIGPYSQGVKIASQKTLIFVSGQLPIDPQSGRLIEGDMAVMTHQVINNLEKILQAGGGSLEYVVRVDIFLKNLKKDFALMNQVYASRFTGKIPPARQTVQVTELPLDSLIEISCIGFVVNE